MPGARRHFLYKYVRPKHFTRMWGPATLLVYLCVGMGPSINSGHCGAQQHFKYTCLGPGDTSSEKWGPASLFKAKWGPATHNTIFVEPSDTSVGPSDTNVYYFILKWGPATLCGAQQHFLVGPSVIQIYIYIYIFLN